MMNDTSPLPAGEALLEALHPIQDLVAPEGGHFKIVAGHVLLIGSRSRSSGSLAFPRREVCLTTGARDMEDMSFGPRGTLYSFATVHVSSSRPVPYTIGYVDFENGVRVLAHVMGDEATLECDMPVELRSDGERWYVEPVQHLAKENDHE